MNMFALSDADPGEEGSQVRVYWFWYRPPPRAPPPPPQKNRTKKYPNSIKIWTFTKYKIG